MQPFSITLVATTGDPEGNSAGRQIEPVGLRRRLHQGVVPSVEAGDGLLEQLGKLHPVFGHRVLLGGEV